MRSAEDYYARQPAFTGTSVVEIDVPSGRLLAADSLCSVKHFDIEPPLSINSGAGLDAWAHLLAEQANTAYAFVGNSSPLITQQTDDSFEVISPEWEDFAAPELNADEKIVASICTDHWATMLTDYQNWLDHGGPAIEVANSKFAVKKFMVFTVTPGKYRWTVFSHADAFDAHAPGRTTYARLHLITD